MPAHMNKKLKEAQSQKVPFMLIAGGLAILGMAAPDQI